MMEKQDICNRCKDVIEWDEEIYFPNNNAVCGYCIEDKEIE